MPAAVPVVQQGHWPLRPLRRFPWKALRAVYFRGMFLIKLHRTLLAGVLAVSGPCLSAQDIPDENLRERLIGMYPDLLDEHGNIVQPGMVLPNFDLVVDWSPCDLTGLDLLTVSQGFILNFMEGVELTAFPAFPNILASTGGEFGTELRLTGYPGTALPPIPLGVDILLVRNAVRLQDWTIDGTEADPFTIVEILQSGPESAWPTSLSHIRSLTVGDTEVAEPPVLGVGVVRLLVADMPNLEVFPEVTSDVEHFSVYRCPSIISSWSTPQVAAVPVIELSDLAGLTELINLPEQVDVLLLRNVWPTVEWPVSLHTLALYGAEGFATQGPQLLPADLRVLTVEYNSNLSVVSWPATLERLEYTMAAFPVTSAFPSTLRILKVVDSGVLSLPPLPEGLETFEFTGNGEICLQHLPSTLTSVVSDLPCFPNQPPDVPVLPLCNIFNSDCPEHSPYFTGTVFYDLNGDGVQDANEWGAPDVVVMLMPGPRLTATDADGHYAIAAPAGEYAVTVEVPAPFFDLLLPEERTVELAEAPDLVDGVDFGLGSMQPVIWDRKVNIMGMVPRPGFERSIRIDWSTQGMMPDTSDRVITVELDPVEEFLSIDHPDATVEGNVITIVHPADGTSGAGQATLVTRIPIATPLGEQLVDRISVMPLEADAVPENNTMLLGDNIVVGAYDPNDKRVVPAVLSPSDVALDTVLDYTIRFQNTGTYHAERVVITDTLSADLRWETFRFVQASHACGWFLRDGVVHFVFDDIMLPDSNANEPDSHGAVRFTIRPRTDLVHGDQVVNVANIHFDFNEPVITEPCVFAVQDPTSITSAIAPSEVRVYPIPTQGRLMLEQDGDWNGARITVLDPLGKPVAIHIVKGSRTVLDLSGSAPGAYLLRLEDADRRQVLRVLVQ